MVAGQHCAALARGVLHARAARPARWPAAEDIALLHHLEDAMAARRVDLILWAGPRSSRSCTTKDLVDDYSVCQGSD